MTPARALLALAAGWCLGAQGCAVLVRSTPPPCTVPALLEQAEKSQGAAPAELDAAVHGAQKDFADRGGVCERFRLALLLLGPDARIRDDARAAALLSDYLDSAPPAAGGFRSLAKLVVADTRRERELTRRAADERSRADALKRQLEELKEIERIMNERQKR